MKMVATHFAWLWQKREGRCGKEPLPNELARRIFVFLCQLSWEEHTCVPISQVLGVKSANLLHLSLNFRQSASWQGNGPIFLAFAVVDGQQHGIQAEAVDAQIDAFGQAQAATVEEQNDQAVRGLQLS